MHPEEGEMARLIADGRDAAERVAACKGGRRLTAALRRLRTRRAERERA